MFSKSVICVALAILSWQCQPALSQTYSSCNPLYTTSCPVDTALGKSIDVDFTKGSVNSFTASGNPTYDSSGVHFTVAKSGDAPQLTSLFYIMFGKVEITMKTAPGAGIVSTLVLESDDLDEIDIEWLGADSSEMQTNYFGKGDVTSYNRGAFNPAPNNQNDFITYTVEWTSSQVTWSVGSTVVRVLTAAAAGANYPQTPMQVKFGSWSGGDPSNPPGTIAWARGPTDYTKGPFTMSVQSLAVTDYSTGTQYKYGDTSGSWQSIQAVGGKVNGNAGSAGTPVSSAGVPAMTSASLIIPAGFGNSHTDTAHQTGWPWVAEPTTMATATAGATAAAGVPSGWIITSEGKIVPASSAAVSPISTPYCSPGQLSLQYSAPSGVFLETITGWDDHGFPTTRTITQGSETAPVSYDQQGFPVTATPTSGGPGQAPSCGPFGCGNGNKVLGTKTPNVAEAIPALNRIAVIGIAAILAERVLL